MVKFDSWAIYQGDKLIPFKTVYDNWVSPSWIKHFVLKFSFQVKFEKKKTSRKGLQMASYIFNLSPTEICQACRISKPCFTSLKLLVFELVKLNDH